MGERAFPLPSNLDTICRDFLKTPTACSRGDDCKFVHLHWIKEPSPDGAPFCIKDIFSKCERGHRCNFFHIRMGKTPSVSPSSLAPDGRQYCIDFRRGMCTKGNKCRFNHGVSKKQHQRRNNQSPPRVKLVPSPKSWPKTHVPSENPWAQDFRVANIRTFLESKEMNSTDDVFEGKNHYKKPIKPRREQETDGDEVEELLREPFSLFNVDPFTPLRKEVESVGAFQRNQSLKISPVEVWER